FGKARVREHPRDIEMRLHLAYLEFDLGNREKIKGHPSEALKIIRSAADTFGALARENPLLIRPRSNWGISLHQVSQLQTDLRRYAEAEQSARAEIDLFEALVREVPSSRYYQLYVGLGYASLGKALLKAGKGGEALAILGKSVAILETAEDTNNL